MFSCVLLLHRLKLEPIMALASRGIVDLACVAVISDLGEAGGFPQVGTDS